MNRVSMICASVLIAVFMVTLWAEHRDNLNAETRRVEYCMRFAPYATLDELTACLAQARG